METKLLLVLSALGLACSASIQDPYIHDSAEDQIAMESGPQHSVAVPPPDLFTTPEVPAAAAAEEAEQSNAIAPPEEQKQQQPKPAEKDTVSPDTFTVLVDDAPPTSPAPPSSPPTQSVGGFVLRPTLSPALTQMSLLTRLQSPLQYPLGGLGGTPIILLQPIYLTVPARELEKKAAMDGAAPLPALLAHQPVRRRPLISLMDLLQQGLFAY